MLDSQLLRTLVEFAERGTVAATAQALGYTPSAVSQQLTSLARQARVPLVRRVGRNLVLTPAGTALAQSSTDVLDALERAEAAVSANSPELRGEVHLAIFQSAALALLPATLDALRDRAPLLRLRMTQVEPESALRDTWARDYDIVVAEEYPHHRAPLYKGLTQETLVRDTIRLCVSPEAQRHKDVAGLADCVNLPWVMEPQGTATRHYGEQACRAAGFEPDVRFETSDLQAHLALVESGHAVAFLPSLFLERASAAVTAMTHAPDQRRTVFAAMRESSAGEPGIAVVLNALRDAAAPLDAVD
ncbi:LysR family transcriptional regulator [Demequina flava]|uniref:LysR family transcriptional regulator n=1 Tax=Demequina flava TaxID=1095025 RepID=UPI00078284E6|nr:LysR family transcriptional regulator [Demequina flava]